MPLRKLIWLASLAPMGAYYGSLEGLERLPWFRNIWEFTFTPTYTYSQYPSVQNGVPKGQQKSNDHLISFDFAVPFTSQWQMDSQVEFADTPRQSMGLRSLAFQPRYLWLDDLLGDPVSLTTGAVIRGVTHHSLKDVSSPYHSYLNFEINSALGREWNRGFDWHVRSFGGASIGIATRGFPWVSAFTGVEGQMHQAHRLGMCLEGALGFGHRKRVYFNHFNGYAFIEHRNIDVSVKYTYVFEIWGQLSCAYTRRIYAGSFPEKVNFFTFSYMLPFSLF